MPVYEKNEFITVFEELDKLNSEENTEKVVIESPFDTDWDIPKINNNEKQPLNE